MPPAKRDSDNIHAENINPIFFMLHSFRTGKVTIKNVKIRRKLKIFVSLKHD